MSTRLRTVVLFLLSFAAARAATLTVGPGQQYPTIQGAINAAAAGDTVLVSPGTYYENIDFKGKAITVTSLAGPATTIIDGSHATGFVVTLGTPMAPDNSYRAPAVLDGLTIQNGSIFYVVSLPNGGGINLSGNATVQNNIILNNYPFGIHVLESNALVQNNHILQTVSAANASDASTGIYIASTSVFSYDYLLSPPSLTITGNLIENNYGDGILNYYAVENGPPAFPYLFTYSSNVIRNNGSSGSGAGVAIYAYGGTHVIVDNLITGNAATGLSMELAASIGSTAPFQPIGVVTNNTIAENNTSSLPNQATELSIFGIPQTFTNNLVVHTGATSFPALYCGQGSYGLSGTPVITKPTLDHNDFYAPNSPPLTPSATGCVGTWTANQFADPLFVSAATSDFHLSASSPEIDAGNNAAPDLPAKALDGNARIEDGTGKGTAIVDIGAYEFSGPDAIAEILTSSLDPSPDGQPVTFTAQLSNPAGSPTGSVQFTDAGMPIAVQPVSGGVATFTTSSLTVGSHAITANYLPTGSFQPATAALTQIVTGYPTTITLTCNPSTLYTNATAQLFASLTSPSGPPTGSVTFTDNAATLGQPANLTNGSASLTYTGQTAGTHILTATYVPTGNFAGGSASCAEVVTGRPTTTALTSSPNPSNAAQSVTFTASTTYGGPAQNLASAGTVSFMEGTTTYATVPVTATGASTGAATYTTSALPAGTHTIVAQLNPPGGYDGSSANVSQVVDVLPVAATLTVTPTTAPAGSTLTLSANIAPTAASGAGTPTGTVTFLIDSKQTTPVLLVNGAATVTIANLGPGTHQISCTYSGSATYTAAACNTVPVTLLNSSATALTVSPNPGFQGQPITLLATITNLAGIPFAGSVTFYDGPQLLGSAPIAAGKASLLTTQLAPGTHPLTATYTGDPTTPASTSPTFQEVILQSDFTLTANPTTLTLATGHHTTFTVTAQSTGAFAGLLQFAFDPGPAHATLTPSATHVTLAPGTSAGTSIYLDTDDVIGYLSSTPRSGSKYQDPRSYTALAALLALIFFRRRRRLPALVALLCAALVLTSATGCSGKYPASVAPGNYTLRITASSPVQTHTLSLPLTVTE